MSGARWLGWLFQRAGGFSRSARALRTQSLVSRGSRPTPATKRGTLAPFLLPLDPHEPLHPSLSLPCVRSAKDAAVALGSSSTTSPFSPPRLPIARAHVAAVGKQDCGSLPPFPPVGSKACGRGREPLRWRRQRVTTWIGPCRREKMGERERRKERREARRRTGEGHRPAPARSGATWWLVAARSTPGSFFFHFPAA